MSGGILFFPQLFASFLGQVNCKQDYQNDERYRNAHDDKDFFLQKEKRENTRKKEEGKKGKFN